MQPPTAAPRQALTSAQVNALIETSPSIIVGNGCELLDAGLSLIEDISADFVGGSVSRKCYDALHGTCDLYVARELDWGRAILRPYMTLSDGTLTAKFWLGAYYTSTPAHNLEESPATFQVAGFDMLSNLDDPIGDSYAVDTGEHYLYAVTDILGTRGVTAYLIDMDGAEKVLPAPMVWTVTDNPTWLRVVNDLLAACGYQGIWSDWEGRLRIQPYDAPRERPSEFTYLPGTASLLTSKRSVIHDYYASPNRWIFWFSNQVDSADGPTENAGRYTYTNDNIGPTSVQARGGRIITRAEGVQVADQTALETFAHQAVDADMAPATMAELTSFPVPLHWHFDRVSTTDPTMPFTQALVTAWTLPLDGSEMSQSWTVLDGI